jgi:hypothetical protein
VVSLTDMPRPFTKLKSLDMEEVSPCRPKRFRAKPSPLLPPRYTPHPPNNASATTACGRTDLRVCFLGHGGHRQPTYFPLRACRWRTTSSKLWRRVERSPKRIIEGQPAPRDLDVFESRRPNRDLPQIGTETLLLTIPDPAFVPGYDGRRGKPSLCHAQERPRCPETAICTQGGVRWWGAAVVTYTDQRRIKRRPLTDLNGWHIIDEICLCFCIIYQKFYDIKVVFAACGLS